MRTNVNQEFENHEIQSEKNECNIEEFLTIIEKLRSRDGCPWDQKQTHASLIPCIKEETAEVLAGIRILEKTGNSDNLKEELGDMLLQVVMQSQIASEEQLFTFEDVVDGIAKKMIRRHPHVFAKERDLTTKEVLHNWEQIKQMEKVNQFAHSTPLREIPQELSSLARADKIIKKCMNQEIENIHLAISSWKSLEQLEIQEIQQLQWQLCLIARQRQISLDQLLTNSIEELLDELEPLKNM